MKCEYCGKEFIGHRESQRFCCRDCYNNHKKENAKGRGSKSNCIVCGKEFIKSRESQRFCGSSCFMKYSYQKGHRDGKEITKKAHEQVRQNALKKFKEKPVIYIGKRGYKIINLPLISKEAKRFRKTKMYLHHYIFCKHHNITKIPEGYHIHHIDGNCLNNELDNLQLIEAGEHTKLHYKIRTDKQ